MMKPLHPLDKEDSISPSHREGRRIAAREDRHRAILFKLTTAEHNDLRRLAHNFGYSVSHTCRMLIKERVETLWPNIDDRPNVLELDIEDKKLKSAAKKKSDGWVQRSKNAFQRKEMKFRQEVEWAKEKQKKLKEREEIASAKLKELEDIRAVKRAGTRKMYREIDAQKLRAHKIEKESFDDVHKELAKEVVRLGRPLTESEKWAIGNRVRASVGSEEDLKIEAKVARVILDKERKIKRKLTERESWAVRDAVRNR